jgi:mono/diheme cytochrome c family protein
MKQTLLWAVVLALPATGYAQPKAVAEQVDFAKVIQPLLARSCVACHGPAKQLANLRLDTPKGLLDGGDSGPIFVAGKSQDSRLIHAVTGTNDAAIMPPKQPRLTQGEIATIAGWIDQGAKLPNLVVAEAKKPTHWAFLPVAKPPIPMSAAHPIDAFVLERLSKEKLKPSPEASKETLLRRLSLDLTGLPPSPKEIDDYLADTRADAYERQVDRLLASPHYGERWGRHWLDLARYADSNGYSIDSPRTIWPYRDWVINAINRDLPFDRFTIEQLAGDLLPKATLEQKIATGFHRNTQKNEEGGIDVEQFRVESVVDRVNTTGSVWLGLTVGCCQCHNHKFDPLSQKEYFQLFAFFNNQDEPELSLGLVDPTWTPPKAEPDENPKKDPPKKEPKKDPPKKKTEGPPMLKTLVLAERKMPRPTKLLIGGDFTRPGMPVTPGTFAVLPALAKSENPTRLELAKWLVSPDNPLTPRVAVNRLWAQYFGQGLVETVNDFGTQGTPPTHPELLDWLAGEFVRQGWSIKKLHKIIVTSATYRQSSNVRDDLKTVDANNRLLARQSRIRLEAEVVRDSTLVASGLFSPKVGGPSVFPPLPPGLDGFTQVKRPWPTNTGPDRYRRGMYTSFRRSNPHPALSAFDAPDAGTTCTRRNRSNTPLQALTLLNDEGYVELAYGLAARLLTEAPDDPSRRNLVMRLCLGRSPNDRERDRLRDYFEQQRKAFQANPADATRLLQGGGPAGKTLAAMTTPDPATRAAWVLTARVVLNLDEAITRE